MEPGLSPTLGGCAHSGQVAYSGPGWGLACNYFFLILESVSKLWRDKAILPNKVERKQDWTPWDHGRGHLLQARKPEDSG